ncbi:hypothetical protein AXG93_1923s1640 [Marchantia polymorpha subsp. ruderalis]|uniref:Uncharacterized protein n=1 Tax=Marchantia polymorpha subsp. ruderalis TaxID=1480154 RepID=A0A176VDF5_MARPO|nr:hypothetical protein AXG93_1923s1640 [Marchantia polymorpha subsp. ruderalis]
MASVCSPPDHLLAVCCCHRDSFAVRNGSAVPVSVRFSDFHLRAGGWRTTGPGGSGVARHSSRLRIRCSETQSAVVSAQLSNLIQSICVTEVPIIVKNGFYGSVKFTIRSITTSGVMESPSSG